MLRWTSVRRGDDGDGVTPRPTEMTSGQTSITLTTTTRTANTASRTGEGRHRSSSVGGGGMERAGRAHAMLSPPTHSSPSHREATTTSSFDAGTSRKGVVGHWKEGMEGKGGGLAFLPSSSLSHPRRHTNSRRNSATKRDQDSPSPHADARGGGESSRPENEGPSEKKSKTNEDGEATSSFFGKTPPNEVLDMTCGVGESGMGTRRQGSVYGPASVPISNGVRGEGPVKVEQYVVLQEDQRGTLSYAPPRVPMVVAVNTLPQEGVSLTRHTSSLSTSFPTGVESWRAGEERDDPAPHVVAALSVTPAGTSSPASASVSSVPTYHLYHPMPLKASPTSPSPPMAIRDTTKAASPSSPLSNYTGKKDHGTTSHSDEEDEWNAAPSPQGFLGAAQSASRIPERDPSQGGLPSTLFSSPASGAFPFSSSIGDFSQPTALLSSTFFFSAMERNQKEGGALFFSRVDTAVLPSSSYDARMREAPSRRGGKRRQSH